MIDDRSSNYLIAVAFICWQKKLDETIECLLQYPSFEVWLGLSQFFLMTLS